MDRKLHKSHYSEARRVFAQIVEALEITQSAIASDFDTAVELCLGCRGKLVLTGIGKSGIIAHKVAATLASTGTSAVFLNAGEALHGDMGMISREDIVVMFSNSANTPELIQMIPSIRKIGARTLGLFGCVTTQLAKDMDGCLNLSVTDEACPLNLAPMTSSTIALVVGDSLASALMKARGFTKNDFAVLHPGGSLGKRLLYRVGDVMVKRGNLPIAKATSSLHESIILLGEGRLGAVLVCDSSDKLLGILVEADVRRNYLKGVLPETEVQKVMTTNPRVIGPEALLGEAVQLMESPERRVYVLPVVDKEQRLVGLLRMHDILS